MTSQTALAQSDSSRDLAGHYLMVSKSGAVCDLTDLLIPGAKLTILFIQLCRDWHHRGHTGDWAYHQLRRACIAWEKSGNVTIERNSRRSCSVELEERPGMYVRATATPPNLQPYLIRGLQNSKLFAAPRNGLRLRSDDDPLHLQNIPVRSDAGSVQTTLPHMADRVTDELNSQARLSDKSRGKPRKKYSSTGMPGGKMSWYRRQALQRCIEINDGTIMTRVNDKHGNKIIHPELQQKLDQMHNLFRAWKRDVRNKKIILKNLVAGRGEDPYLVLDYKTRFTDNYRAWKNEEIFQGGIETSLRTYQTAVFLTLTTDPQIFMNPRGDEFKRHIKDGKRTREFTATGKGLNLLAANRHESTAWRKWYEAECYRRGFRIPYIRVVEFQKNGLIHTHVLLFGIQWNTPWHEFANDWGTKYQQGFMNKAYQVENRNGKWVWAHAEFRPADANNRDPADYLMKYLKKAQDVPAVKCKKCHKIVSIPDDKDVICPECGEFLKAPKDGRYMYWVCGKRFFTMSQALRVYDFDREIEEEMRKKQQTAIYEYIGAAQGGEVEKFIQTDCDENSVPKNAREAGDIARFLAEYRRDQTPPIRLDHLRIVRPRDDEFLKKWPFDYEESSQSRQDIEESPNITDGIDLTDYLGSITPERVAYEKQLAEETRLMEERRRKLKERSG